MTVMQRFLLSVRNIIWMFNLSKLCSVAGIGGSDVQLYVIDGGWDIGNSWNNRCCGSREGNIKREGLV